jgi:hypothetical protein
VTVNPAASVRLSCHVTIWSKRCFQWAWGELLWPTCETVNVGCRVTNSRGIRPRFREFGTRLRIWNWYRGCKRWDFKLGGCFGVWRAHEDWSPFLFKVWLLSTVFHRLGWWLSFPWCQSIADNSDCQNSSCYNSSKQPFDCPLTFFSTFCWTSCLHYLVL